MIGAGLFAASLIAIADWFARHQHRTPDQRQVDDLARRDRKRTQ